jgi:hypothetical protein
MTSLSKALTDERTTLAKREIELIEKARAAEQMAAQVAEKEMATRHMAVQLAEK